MHAMHWLVSFWQSALLKIDGNNGVEQFPPKTITRASHMRSGHNILLNFHCKISWIYVMLGFWAVKDGGRKKKLLRIMKIWHYVLTAEIYYKSCLLQVYTSITQWFSNASEHLACLQPTSSNYCFRFAAIISLATSHLGQINCKNLVWTKRQCTITLYIEAECNTFIEEWP